MQICVSKIVNIKYREKVDLQIVPFELNYKKMLIKKLEKYFKKNFIGTIFYLKLFYTESRNIYLFSDFH